MKLIVCIKQVPASNEVNLDPITHTILRENIESVMNPFDAFALEEAVRLKEKYGGCIWALSMGIPAAEKVLKEALSLKANSALLLSDRKFAGADTLATAYTLSLGIKKIGNFDLIICGKQATDGDTAQVGPSMAQQLGIPCVTDISRIIRIDRNSMVCKKLTDDGYQTVEIRLPALITVSKEINVPRLPSLAGIFQAASCEVMRVTANDLLADESRTGLNGSPTQVVRTFIPRRETTAEYLCGDPAEAVSGLLKKLQEKNPI